MYPQQTHRRFLIVKAGASIVQSIFVAYGRKIQFPATLARLLMLATLFSSTSPVIAVAVPEILRTGRAPNRQEQLPIGKTVEKMVAPGEYHPYLVELKRGEMLVIETESETVDTLIVIGTRDQKLLKAGNYLGPGRKEVLAYASPDDADYLVLTGSSAYSEKGSFRLSARIEDGGARTAQRRLDAEDLMQRAKMGLLDAEEARRQKLMQSKGVITAEIFDLTNKARLDAAGNWQKASALWRGLGDKYWEAAALHQAGLLNFQLNKLSEALSFYLQALSLQKEAADNVGQMTTLHDAAKVYLDTADRARALEFFEQSLNLARAVGNRHMEAHLLTDIGTTYSALGEVEKALKNHQESLQVSRSTGDKSAISLALNNIGEVYVKTGRSAKALDAFQQALPLAEVLGDGISKSTFLFNIGQAYAYLSEYEKAFEYLFKANQTAGAAGYTVGRVRSAVAVANLFAKVGDYQNALLNYQFNLPFFRELGDVRSEANTFNDIGFAYSRLGNKQKSLENYNQALALFEKIGDLQGEGTTRGNLGNYYREQGNKAKALELFQRALLLKRAIRDREGEAITLADLTFLWAEAGNLKLAVLFGKLSVNRLQEIRGEIQSLDSASQKGFLLDKEEYYRLLAEVLIRQERLAEAQQVLNAFKDQQFFDFEQTRTKAVPITLTPREGDFAARYEMLSERVGAAGGQLQELKRTIGSRSPAAEESAQLRKLEAKLRAATDEFAAFLKQAETEFSQRAGEKDRVGQIPDLTQMQATLSELNGRTGQKALAVYQLVGEENFSAILISPNSIEKVTVPVNGKELNLKAKKLWALLQSDKYDTTKLSKQIYDAVFKPLEEKLPKDTTTIMWSLDGNLRYLPMAALWDGNRFLVERYSHVVFTRTDQERMTRAVSAAWTGFGFGASKPATVNVLGERLSFSPLPGVSEELSAIFKSAGGGLLEGPVLTDTKFTRQSFIESLRKRPQLVHISSHFSFRAGDEARSFLLLGDGGVLTLEEMKGEKDLFQGVELLTLSACNTAAQQAGSLGREIDGFAELAQRLGTGAVMATLWPVADNSTPWLMRAFYSAREGRSGTTKTEALRNAQLSLFFGQAETKPLPPNEKAPATSKVQVVIVPKGGRRDNNQSRSDVVVLDEADAPAFKRDPQKPFAHPYYWSPFILIGNWQ